MTASTKIERIPHIIKTSRDAFAKGVMRSYDQRIAHLHTFLQMITEGKAALAEAVHKDFGKPAFELQVHELMLVRNEIKLALSELKNWMKPEYVPRRLPEILDSCYIQQDPLGVVLIIGAWNYPTLLTLSGALGALAAGNTVVIKPSEVAPHSSQCLAELIRKFFDPSVLTVIQGGIREITELLKHHFDHILFTGSSRIARVVMKAAAENLTPVTLELGGKSPVIIDPRTNLTTAARRIMWGRSINSGQTCIAPEYILIPEASKPAFIQAAQKALDEFYSTNIEESPDYARIISQAHYDRLVGCLGSGDIVVGGQRNPQTRFLAPTVLDNVDRNSLLMQEEMFGPILTLVTCETLDEAIHFVNERDKPLALYVFSNDKSFVHRVITESSSGGVVVNDTMMHISVDTLPFGGVGKSGMGAYHGHHTFKLLSHQKAVLRRQIGFEFLNLIRYPPYSSPKLDLLNYLPVWQLPLGQTPFLTIMMLVGCSALYALYQTL